MSDYEVLDDIRHAINEVTDAILEGQPPKRGPIIIMAKWVGPECGTANASTWTAEELRHGRAEYVSFCEIESGGCDRRVVLDATVSVRVDVSLVNPVETVTNSDQKEMKL